MRRGLCECRASGEAHAGQSGKASSTSAYTFPSDGVPQVKAPAAAVTQVVVEEAVPPPAPPAPREVRQPSQEHDVASPPSPRAQESRGGGEGGEDAVDDGDAWDEQNAAHLDPQAFMRNLAEQQAASDGMEVAPPPVEVAEEEEYHATVQQVRDDEAQVPTAAAGAADVPPSEVMQRAANSERAKRIVPAMAHQNDTFRHAPHPLRRLLYLAVAVSTVASHVLCALPNSERADKRGASAG